jgi:hypothetical protein
MDQATFRTLPPTFRAAPFWSWNDDLEPEELVRQVGLMDEAGWGGFFTHSRVGLVTPYLSEQWMECVRVTVAEAKRRGMAAYLYENKAGLILLPFASSFYKFTPEIASLVNKGTSTLECIVVVESTDLTWAGFYGIIQIINHT